MKYFPFFIVLIFCSCNRNQKIIAERLSITDSAAINFFAGNGTMDSVVSVTIIRDKKQLDTLAQFISDASTGEKQCGVDGSIHFFRSNMVLQDIDFRMNDADCMHFRLKINGEWFTTKLSEEAKRFLERVKNKIKN